MDAETKKYLLNLSEDVVKGVVHNFVRPELEKFIKNSGNKYDDMLLPFMGQLESALLKVVDQIDGEEG